MAEGFNEAQLIRQTQQDIRHFRALYVHYVDRVYAYIGYRVGIQQDVEDLVSETFLRALERIQHFEYRGAWSFGSWLIRIAYYVVNEHYRHHAAPKTPISIEDVPLMEDTPALDDQLILQEVFATLHHLLQSLAPRQQEVIVLKYFGGLRNQEIAALLNIPENTVAGYLSRALSALEKKYHLEMLTHARS